MQEVEHNNSSENDADQEDVQRPQNKSARIQKKRQVRRLRVLETITVLLFGTAQFLTRQVTNFFVCSHHLFLVFLPSG